MTKTIFENLPSTATPLNATNLNSLSNSIIVSQTGTDLNDYTTAGTYYFDGSHTPTHIPTGLVNGWLQVLDSGSTTIKQIWYRQGTNNDNDFETYVRTKNSSGSWGKWNPINNGIYFTDERKIGTYYDGKPIYRKVIRTTSPSSTGWDTTNTNITNLDTLILFTGTIDRGDYINSIPYRENSTGFIDVSLRKSDNKIMQNVGSDLLNKKEVFILEYTKTTD